MIREIVKDDYLTVSNYYSEFSINNDDLFELDSFTKLYVYELNNKVIGFISYSVIYDRAELNYIYVDEKYRKEHIASNLLEFFIEIAISNKCKNITLEVSCNNYIGINLYKKYGFKEVAIRKNYYNGIDGILMMKELI